MTTIRISKASYHILLVDEPHPKGLSSLLLLNKTLRREENKSINDKIDLDMLEDNHIQLNKLQQVKVNEKFLIKQKKNKNDCLTCVYCGRDDLIIQHWYKKGKRVKNMATVDHIVPKSIGGSRISPKNMVVSCQKCNRKKDKKIGYQDENGNWKF